MPTKAEVEAATDVFRDRFPDMDWDGDVEDFIKLVLKVAEDARRSKKHADDAFPKGVLPLPHVTTVVILGDGKWFEARCEDGSFLMSTGPLEHFLGHLPKSMLSHLGFRRRVRDIELAREKALGPMSMLDHRRGD